MAATGAFFSNTVVFVPLQIILSTFADNILISRLGFGFSQI